ncbi:MAG: hypothetical protein H6774_02560 [Pseudomonadales bacterium]|nr:hypothetical protein [Candidatus Woesebacteria bacterium]MCB9801946.1 hypothetical protein [Pseudomonadales bacterium]
MNKVRTFIPIGVLAAVMCATTVLRLFDVQIIRGEQFAHLAEQNRVFTAPVPAERGVFFDRYGDFLVYNSPEYFLLDNPTQAYSQVTPVSRDQALAVMATDSARVSYKPSRVYTFPTVLSHVVGWASSVTAEELQQNPSLSVRSVVGKTGLERFFERNLQGQEGSRQYEVNALGQHERLLATTLGSPGQSLTTTIDPYLSTMLARSLGEQKGAAVVFDAATGAVLALVSTPGFDANLFSHTPLDMAEKQQRAQALQSVVRDERNPMFNRAVGGAYPPGSVFKLVTAATGLENGSFNTQTSVIDTGVLEVGQYSFANWFYTQYGGTDGEVSVVRALARSNDIFFYKAAEWIGPDGLAQGARLLGLGAPTGIELLGESAGLVPDPQWKEEVVGEKWFLGNTYHFGIGQADLLVTPLQVAQYTQVFANQGLLCHPHLIQYEDAQSTCSEVGLSSETIDTVLEGMIDACSDGGTAYPFFPINAAVEASGSARERIRSGAVACKTGTAEFGGVDENGYRSTHGWFTAILDTRPLLSQTTAPVQALRPSAVTEVSSSAELYTAWREKIDRAALPEKLVMVVLVESDEEQPYKEGSRDAAPVVKDIVDWMGGTMQVATDSAEVAPAGQAE